MKVILLFISLIACATLSAKGSYTPGESVRGKVTDGETGSPLPFANIAVAGQPRGTVTNSEGVFVLDLTGLESTDSILFSYIGYALRRVTVGELVHQTEVQLFPIHIDLAEVEVSARELSIREILGQVRKNYEVNYPEQTLRNRYFLHTYEHTPFPIADQVKMKHSNFEGLDKQTFNELIGLIPRDMITYQDAILDQYRHEDEYKLIPVEGVSLLEGSYKEVFEVMEDKLEGLMTEIQEVNENEDTYFKFRSGVLSHKLDVDTGADSLWELTRTDTLHEIMETKSVRYNLDNLLGNFTGLDCKSWEFINDPGKYDYRREGVTTCQGELVWHISYSPRRGGLFEGDMYISTKTFAVLELDFAYASGKDSENFHLLGFGHSLNYREGRVIYEKGPEGYYLKYVYARQNESISIDRKLSIMTKEKRFMTDKELNEMVLDIDAEFTVDSFWELLLLDRNPVTKEQYEQLDEPVYARYRKEWAYTPEMWNNRTVIAPTAELQKLTRKEQP